MKQRIVIATAAIIISIAAPALAQTDVGQQPPHQTIPQPHISDVTCYQSGQKVIEEKGIRNLMLSKTIIYGDRPNGTQVTVMAITGDAGTVCKLVEAKTAPPHK